MLEIGRAARMSIVRFEGVDYAVLNRTPHGVAALNAKTVVVHYFHPSTLVERTERRAIITLEGKEIAQ